MARGLLLSRQDSGVSKNEQQDGGDDSEYANQFDPAMSYEIYGNLEDRYQGLTPPPLDSDPQAPETDQSENIVDMAALVEYVRNDQQRVKRSEQEAADCIKKYEWLFMNMENFARLTVLRNWSPDAGPSIVKFFITNYVDPSDGSYIKSLFNVGRSRIISKIEKWLWTGLNMFMEQLQEEPLSQIKDEWKIQQVLYNEFSMELFVKIFDWIKKPIDVANLSGNVKSWCQIIFSTLGCLVSRYLRDTEYYTIDILHADFRHLAFLPHYYFDRYRPRLQDIAVIPVLIQYDPGLLPMPDKIYLNLWAPPPCEEDFDTQSGSE